MENQPDSVISVPVSEPHSPNSEPKLRIAEHYCIPINGGRFQIRTATQWGILSGRSAKEILPRLLPLLDGTQTESELLRQLEPYCSAGTLGQILEYLKQKGLVQQVDGQAASSDLDLPQMQTLLRYFGRRGPAEETLAAIRRAHVMIVNAGPVVPVLAGSLACCGIPRITLVGESKVLDREIRQSNYFVQHDQGKARAEVLRERIPPMTNTTLNEVCEFPATREEWAKLLCGISVAVVLLDGPILFYPWLEAFNAAALETNTPWTSVALLDGEEIHIGPTVMPGVTACYKCFELRYKSNLIYLEQYNAMEAYFHAGNPTIDFGLLLPVPEIAASFTALEVLRILTPQTVAKTTGKLMVFSVADFTCKFHPVLKLPRCPSCSPVRNQPRQRVWS